MNLAMGMEKITFSPYKPHIGSDQQESLSYCHAPGWCTKQEEAKAEEQGLEVDTAGSHTGLTMNNLWP